uniref:Uncharacterized protein n=5 Tax=Aegilops tauschii subsp. strangulata TaxID=200361 RepID=A0A453IB50_AEGTS
AHRYPCGPPPPAVHSDLRRSYPCRPFGRRCPCPVVKTAMASGEDGKAAVVLAPEDGGRLAWTRARLRGDALVSGGDGYGRSGGRGGGTGDDEEGGNTVSRADPWQRRLLGRKGGEGEKKAENRSGAATEAGARRSWVTADGRRSARALVSRARSASPRADREGAREGNSRASSRLGGCAGWFGAQTPTLAVSDGSSPPRMSWTPTTGSSHALQRLELADGRPASSTSSFPEPSSIHDLCNLP